MHTTPLPSLFVSHGAPLFALEAGTSGPALTRWGASLRASHPVRGVVLMSPHWMADTPQVMTHPQPETWHDFGGFPPALYQLRYPAPGDPALAAEALQALAVAGVAASGDSERPFDHGAWVPLMHLFPEATLPVVQVALPRDADPAGVLAIGQALEPLRAQGVLVVGTGSMTHNLSEFFRGIPPMDSPAASYVGEFARWVEGAVTRHDVAALLGYRQHAPHAARAHPTDDHFLPLFFALGAAGWGGSTRPPVHYLGREVMYGLLAMDALSVG